VNVDAGVAIGAGGPEAAPLEHLRGRGCLSRGLILHLLLIYNIGRVNSPFNCLLSVSTRQSKGQPYHPLRY